MKAEIISKEKNVATIEMAFSAEELGNAINSVYTKEKGKFTVDGFRKGKAPRKLIEMKYGKGIFLEDAVGNLIQGEYSGMIDSLGLEQVGRPEIEIKDIQEGQPFTAVIKIGVVPEVQLVDYKGIEVKKISYSVTEEDVQKELEMLQRRNGRMVVVERPAQKGDSVLIDYEGFSGGEAFEGGAAKKQPLTLGSGAFIPGFEDQLIGAKAGDEVDVKVTFPEQYHSEDLAGQDAVFKVVVHEVRQTELPVLDDEFAKDVSEFDTLDEYKADIKAKIEKDVQAKAESEQNDAVLEVLCQNTELDIPPAMTEAEVDRMVGEVTEQISSQGMNMDTYLKYIGKTMSSLREGLKADAAKRIKLNMILEAVVKAENIEATQEEIDDDLEAIAKLYKKELEEIKNDFSETSFDYIRQNICIRKAIALIVDHAKVIEGE